MITPPTSLDRLPRHPPDRPRSETVLCARDRLLAALASSPRLSPQEADRINRVVQEAREVSIADELSA